LVWPLSAAKPTNICSHLAEGTVCPISFVKDTLFPYALKALPDVLAVKWDSEEFKPYRDAFPKDARSSPAALQAHVEDLTKRDVKVAYLKNLQGYLWETGYKTGAYSTPLFQDVAPRLKAWKDGGIDLAIYSSGSVFAQKLLFEHVHMAGSGTQACEDLKDLFSAWFDTTNAGPKTEAESYRKIEHALNVSLLLP
jgi:enolase-phosphatase E1